MAPKSPYLCALCGSICDIIQRNHPAPQPQPSDTLYDRQPQSQCRRQLPQQTQMLQRRQKQPCCCCCGCSALIYCCEAHRRRHAALPGGHSTEECARMALQVQRAAELADFPFPWFRSIGAVHLTTEQDLGQNSLSKAICSPIAAIAKQIPQAVGVDAAEGAIPPPGGATTATQVGAADPRVADLNKSTARTPPPPLPPARRLCMLLLAQGHLDGAPYAPTCPTTAGTLATGFHRAAEDASEGTAAAVDRPWNGGGASGGDGHVGWAMTGGDALDHHDVDKVSGRNALNDGCSGAGGGCQAPGCWRRVCGCETADGDDGSGGRCCDGADLPVPSSDHSDWGSLPPPVLARLQLPRRRNAPLLLLQLPPAAAAVTAAAASRTAISTSSTAGTHEGGATWAGQVWHLPPHLTPPLRGPDEPRGGAGQRIHPLPPPPQMASSAPPPAQTDPWDAPPCTSSVRRPCSHLPHQHGGVGGSGGGGGHTLDGDDGSGGYRPHGVVDWLSYYRWAGLPLGSPAALLLHFPLSLYGALRLVDERLGGALLRRGRQPPGPSAAQLPGGHVRAENSPVPEPGRPISHGDRGSGGRHRAGAGCMPHGGEEKEEDEGEEDKAVAARAALPSPSAKRRKLASFLCSETTFPGGGCAAAGTVAAAAGLRTDPQRELRGAQEPWEEQSADGGDTAAAGGAAGGAERRLRDAEEGRAATAGGRWRVDVLYLGPQSELDQLDTFAALLPLLPPGCTLRMHMVGPDVPDGLHGAVLVYDSDELGVAPTISPPAASGPLCIAARGGRGLALGGGGGGGSLGAGVEAAGGHASRDDGRGGAGGGGAAGLGPRVEVVLHSCLLHEAEEEGLWDDGEAAGAAGPSLPQPAPLLVFAPNAGLPVYMSWLPTLELLLARQGRPAGRSGPPGAKDATAEDAARLASAGPVWNGGGAAGGESNAAASMSPTTPRPAAPSPGKRGNAGSEAVGNGWRRVPVACLFTAFNEEECVRSCMLLEELYGVQPDVWPAVNPFRQPLWCVDRVGNRLPSYSNGFMYGWYASQMH